jgi:hypothetical protein
MNEGTLRRSFFCVLTRGRWRGMTAVPKAPLLRQIASYSQQDLDGEPRADSDQGSDGHKSRLGYEPCIPARHPALAQNHLTHEPKILEAEHLARGGLAALLPWRQKKLLEVNQDLGFRVRRGVHGTAIRWRVVGMIPSTEPTFNWRAVCGWIAIPPDAPQSSLDKSF